MMNESARCWVLLAAAFILLSACGKRSPERHQSSLNLFIWSDYLAPDTLSSFEKATGIKTHVLYFDTNETLETQLLAGNGGFDVVLPSAPYFERQIIAGAYQTLDKRKLPHLGNLDPQLMSLVARYDPGNMHGIIYLWGTEGLGYNEAPIRKLLPNAAIDSWALIFDPDIAARLAPCGIHVLDNPAGVTRIVLKYLGRDPNAPSSSDLRDAERSLLAIRPFIHSIDSSPYVSALANGDICVALAYNGDVAQARDRARESKNGIDVKFVVPKEGGIIWFDMIAIPKGAPNPTSAYAFLEHVLNPTVMAGISNSVRYANANAAAVPYMQGAILHDPVIYPTPEERARLFIQLADSSDRARLLTRIWQRFKTGQ
jgi:putrescine transport system substrate-binding protein